MAKQDTPPDDPARSALARVLKEHQRWIATGGRKGVRLTTRVLRGIDWGDARLNLPGTNLSKANLSKANLSKANLTGANLSNAILTEANLSGADLTMADLSGANLFEADLTKADLRRANLFEADLTGANLSGMDLSGMNLSGADLRRANLFEADLTKAHLSGMNLTGADLTGVNLSGADLTGVNLSGMNLCGVNLSGMNLSGADLTEANLSGANLSGVNLSNAILTKADLSGANLSAANLTLARLIRVDLSGALVHDANVRDIHVQELRGLPTPADRLRLGFGADAEVLTGEAAANFFVLPAVVEVFLTRALTDVELGCFHFHQGEVHGNCVATDVYFIGHRREGEGSVLRFQGPTYEAVYAALPDLLAPFRTMSAIDWPATLEAIPKADRPEAFAALVKTESRLKAGRWKLAERLAQAFEGFADARVVKLVEGKNKGLRITVVTNEAMVEKLDRATLQPTALNAAQVVQGNFIDARGAQIAALATDGSTATNSGSQNEPPGR